mmetsp:Transcript_8135/g.12964  ORF Transcript_8135/g.12964 Transcript_8135/m.12964 type:complete len:214 (+) Transcript_8135:825-1466(+)
MMTSRTPKTQRLLLLLLPLLSRTSKRMFQLHQALSLVIHHRLSLQMLEVPPPPLSPLHRHQEYTLIHLKICLLPHLQLLSKPTQRHFLPCHRHLCSSSSRRCLRSLHCRHSRQQILTRQCLHPRRLRKYQSRMFQCPPHPLPDTNSKTFLLPPLPLLPGCLLKQDPLPQDRLHPPWEERVCPRRLPQQHQSRNLHPQIIQRCRPLFQPLRQQM